MKKIFLTLGSSIAIFAPIVSVVACGDHDHDHSETIHANKEESQAWIDALEETNLYFTDAEDGNKIKAISIETLKTLFEGNAVVLKEDFNLVISGKDGADINDLKENDVIILTISTTDHSHWEDHSKTPITREIIIQS